MKYERYALRDFLPEKRRCLVCPVLIEVRRTNKSREGSKLYHGMKALIGTDDIPSHGKNKSDETLLPKRRDGRHERGGQHEKIQISTREGIYV
jgi:hypothetical protein